MQFGSGKVPVFRDAANLMLGEHCFYDRLRAR